GQLHTVKPAITTTYTVTGTDSVGCQATDQVLVTVFEPPVTSILPPEPIVCEGGKTTLNANGGAFYQWMHGPTGAFVEVRPDSTTEYKVQITDANGCFIRDSITVVVDMDCPGPPEGLRAAAISATAITLSWNNMSLTQTGLRIERRTA